MKKLRVLQEKAEMALERWKKLDLRAGGLSGTAPKLHKPFSGSYRGDSWTTEEIGRIGEDLGRCLVGHQRPEDPQAQSQGSAWR